VNNFSAGMSVTINGISCTNVNVVRSAQLACVTQGNVGSATGGPYHVIVTFPENTTSTISNAFSYQ